jgi:hypothetical protein
MWQCDDCGFRINGGCDPEKHECDPRSVVRQQAARLDESFAAFLDTPAGRFEVLYARRRLTER